MKKLLFLVLAFLSLQAWEERIEFSLDGRDWSEGYKSSSNGYFVFELVLPGETVHNWSELVTIQKLPPLEIAFQDYYDNFIAGVKNIDQSFQGRILAQDNESIFFEWWTNDSLSPQRQHEWFKLIKTLYGVFIFRYVTKKIDTVDQIRPVWEKIMREAKVVSIEN